MSIDTTEKRNIDILFSEIFLCQVTAMKLFVNKRTVFIAQTFLESCLSSPMRGTVKLDLCCVFIEPCFL